MAETERRNYSGLQPGVDFDMDEAGARLHVPRADWNTVARQELVGFIVRVEELWEDLSDAGLEASGKQPPAFLDGAHSLTGRYHAAKHLVRVILP